MTPTLRPVVRDSLSWTLLGLLSAVALHIAQVPMWVTAIFALLCAWRVRLALRGSALPSRALRMIAVLAIVVAVLGGYRTLNGVAAGTTLLMLMAALKLLETRSARDRLIVLLISYFLVLAALLRDQSLWMLPLQAAAVWMITAALLRVTQSHQSLAAGACLRLSGKMLAQASPFMLILFLLFPRIPGPFWALPADERATSGLSEELNPGDISELTLSSDAAFRVRFKGPAPPPAQRYWRGPVLHDFDGAVWRTARSFAALGGDVQFSGRTLDYTLMLEPSGQRWVFALDMAESWQRRLHRAFDYQLLSAMPIDRPIDIEMRSRTDYSAGLTLSHTLRTLDTRLPAEVNPRARALAAQMRRGADSAAEYIRDVLAMFRTQQFVYTLTPPKLDRNSVDDFLFNTRSGFCAHYASAFATLMRAAGIPARVVSGYQGGEYNRVGGYWIVRQSDAHAWTELWLEGSGWVRIDPTAAVAPERIERGSSEVLGDAAPDADRLLKRYTWLAHMRDTWDAVDTAWRERVLQFNDRSQLDLLRRLGIDDPDWRALGIALAASLSAALILLGALLARELKFHRPDAVVREYQRFCRRLRRAGMVRAPHEGPLDFARRLRRLQPSLAPQTDPITQLYLELRYGAQPDSRRLEELRDRVRRFKCAAV